MHREEIKTGRKDQPIKAKRQLETGANALADAARGERGVRLVLDDVDITDTIDLSTVSDSTAATRGPAGKASIEASASLPTTCSTWSKTSLRLS